MSKILILDPKGRPSIRDILAHPWFSKPLLPNGSSLLVASAMTPTLSQSGQPPIPEEEVEGAPDKHGRDPSAISYDSSLSNLADETTVSNDSRPEKSLYHDGRQTQVKSSPRHSIDESDGRVPRSPLISRSTSFSGHSPAMTPHSRTPSRTKRRSISSLHTLSERAPPQDSAPTIDYLSMLEQHQSAQFESSSDQKLLDAMDALGLDVGQVKHSVTEEACDATGAIWWMLKRKREVKAAEEATLRTARASNDSRRTTANVMPPSASIPSIGLVESDSNYSFPARRRPRSNSALASSPSTPASPSVTPALLGSPSVPNLSQFKDAPEAEILERKPSPAPLAGLGLGRPEALQQPERPSPNPSPSKPRSASISILQRATSAITGSSNGPGGERGRESQEQTGRATPLGIFFGRKGSGSLGTELQNTSPTGADVEKRPSSREGANAEELEVLGDSPTMPESALPTPSSSHATMGTSPASSAATQPQLSKTAANTTKHRSRGSGLFSTFKFFFNEDRKRRKRNTAADLQNFEGSSVAKFRVATAVNPGSRYAESPNRQPLDSKSSSTSGLRIDTDPVQPSRRSSVSSAHRPAAQRPVRRQSNASRRSVGDHMSTPDKSRPTSVVSADGIAPLMGQNGQNSHQRNRSRRHKRTGSQSSTTSRNSKGSEGHVTSFRRAPTTTTQVRRIERGRPSNRRRDSTSSSIRSFSSRPSSFSEEEAERVPSPMVHKDEPVIEEENELDETAQQGLERERALQRLSGSNTPSDMATHGRVQPSGQNTSERQHPMFAAHKSTSIFNSPAQSQQHRSSTQPKQKLRDVFAASRSHKADDEWVDEEDALEGFSGGFGQAAPSKTNVVLPQESSVGLLGASRYAGVNEAATATESVSGNKRQNPGFKGMATTVEEEEEEE